MREARRIIGRRLVSIHNYLDLSTSHLLETEMDVISATSTDSTLCGSRVIVHLYGAWIHVRVEDADSFDDDEERALAFPNLHKCIVHARSLKCEWINFDADGDIEAELATFDWSGVPTSCPHCGSKDLQDTPMGTNCAACGVVCEDYEA